MSRNKTKDTLVNSLYRRDLLKLGAAAGAAAMVGCAADYSSADDWDSGDLQHLIPLASSSAFNLKVSFHQSLQHVPELRLAGRRIPGIAGDAEGRFWSFVVGDLVPAQSYSLQLFAAGQALCASWPLATLPDPETELKSLKVAAYTCAGGPDMPVFPGGQDLFKPVSYRQNLYDLIVAQQPDLVIANGDHVYWDFHSWPTSPDSALARFYIRYFMGQYGEFDETLAARHPDNESVLSEIGDEQIARCYGVRFRSIPVYFSTDDHDYFDNDDASPERVSFPPNQFHRDLRDHLQRLYFPEFIVDEQLSPEFPGLSEVNGVQLSTHFGRCRVGKLFDAVLYDCGGMLSLDGDQAVLFPAVVEDWVQASTEREDSVHFAHIPSHPMGWTAGKWREWYPDQIHSSGSMLVGVGSDEQGGKYLWQSGWWQQHQRLLEGLSRQKQRKALVLSGDLHLLGAGRIQQSGELDLHSNPVTSVLTGPVGVGGLGWLSRARGLAATVPQGLSVDSILTPQERNGFTLMHLDGQQCRIELMRCPEGYVSPANLLLDTASSFVV